MALLYVAVIFNGWLAVVNGFAFNRTGIWMIKDTNYPEEKHIYNVLQAALLAAGESRVVLSPLKPESVPSLHELDISIFRQPERLLQLVELYDVDDDVIDTLLEYQLGERLEKHMGASRISRSDSQPHRPESDRRQMPLPSLLSAPLRNRRQYDVTKSARALPQNTLRFPPSVTKRDGADKDTEPLHEIYMDMCKSYSEFELVEMATNDHVQRVQVLPNTWVFTTRCLRPEEGCSPLANDVVAKCKQKQSWVEAFARLTDNDPWRWHWILVDSSCNCGIRIGF